MLARKLFSKYSLLVKVLFFILLFGVFSFGKAFSILYINTPITRLYITEIFLLLAIPFLLVNIKKVFRLPKKFVITLILFVALGLVHSFLGMLNGVYFALRDFVVLVLYVSFLPLAYLFFNNLKTIKSFIFLLVLANIINIFLGRCLVLNIYLTGSMFGFIIKAKLINLGLYYGITASFYISFYDYIKSKLGKLFVLVILSVNIYMVITTSLRVVWGSTILLFILMYVFNKKNIFKITVLLVPVFILTSSLLFFLDAQTSNQKFLKVALGKGRALILARHFISSKNKQLLIPTEKIKYINETSDLQQFFKSQFKKENKAVVPTLESRQGFDNIAWRLMIWGQTIKFGLESPLIGKGFGIYPKYKVWGIMEPLGIYDNSQITPAHNHLITIFYKMGFLGLGLFIFLNIYVFVYGLRYKNKCNFIFLKNLLVALLGAFVFWHSTALFFDVIDSPPTSIFLWVFIGLVFSVIALDKSLLINGAAREVKLSSNKPEEEINY